MRHHTWFSQAWKERVGRRVAMLEERVYSLGEETKAKDLVIDTLKEHIRKHPDPAEEPESSRARCGRCAPTIPQRALPANPNH